MGSPKETKYKSGHGQQEVSTRGWYCPLHGVPNMQIKWVFYLSIIGGHKQASHFNNMLDIRTWPQLDFVIHMQFLLMLSNEVMEYWKN
jgi:hypothetical protein